MIKLKILLFYIGLFFCLNGNSQTNYVNKDKLKINEKVFVVKTKNGYDAIDENNKFIFPLAYDEIIELNDRFIKYFKTRKGKKYGLIDFNGIELIAPEYEDIISLKNKKSGESFLKMNLNGKWGLMIFPGKLVRIPFGYDEIGDFGESERLLLVKKDGKYGFKDLSLTSKHISTQLIYDRLENYKVGGSKYVRNGVEGKLVLSKQTGFLIELKDGGSLRNDPLPEVSNPPNKIFEQNGKKGLRDRKTEKIVVTPMYESLYKKELTDRVIYFAKKNEKYGAIDKDGKQLIPFIYEEIRTVVDSKVKPRSFYSTYEDVFYIKNQNGKIGLINSHNQILIPLKYDWIRHSRNHTYLVTEDGKGSFYNVKKGGLTDGVLWDKIERTTHGEAYIAEKSTLKAILNLDGIQITEPIYSILVDKDRLYYFKNQKGERGAMNVDGHLCTPLFTTNFSYVSPNTLTYYEPLQESTDYASSRSIVVNNLGEPKFLDDKIVRRARYANLQVFEENEKMGLMDFYSGGEYLNPKFSEIKFIPPFTNKVLAKMDKKWGIVDINGNWLGSNKYGRIERRVENLALWTKEYVERMYQFKASNEDLYGIINERGEILVDIKYDNYFKSLILDGEKGLLIVKKDNLFGLCKVGVLKEPNEFFEEIYARSGKLIVVKDGKKMEAKITNGNFVTY